MTNGFRSADHDGFRYNAPHMPRPRTLTPEILSAALEGLAEQRKGIDAQIAEVRAMLGGVKPAVTQEVFTGKRGKFSAATRRKMAESQKLRWAKTRGESRASAPAKPKAKHRISPEGLKRIIAATKKRWRLHKVEAAKAKS